MRLSQTIYVTCALAVASCSSAPGATPSTDAAAATEDASVPSEKDAGAADAPASDSAPTPPATYKNPVLAADFPDPFVLREGKTYYAFATNASGKNVRAAKSTDLASWTELPDALPILPSWAVANASLTWAPSVLKRGEQFVLYFTARDSVSNWQCLGRAVANAPEGPYVDDSEAPFICQKALCGSIDASPFVDANGDAYILWKSDENAAGCNAPARLWSQRLGVDGLSLLGTPTELLRRDRNWEAPLVEGPSMVAVGGTYYLFYSAGHWESPEYAIGYATCASAAGPCTKKTLDAPLVRATEDVLGPGGQEVFTDASGKLWMAYHAWQSPIVGYSNGGARSLRIDRVTFSGGVPSLVPSTTEQEL